MLSPKVSPFAIAVVFSCCIIGLLVYYFPQLKELRYAIAVKRQQSSIKKEFSFANEEDRIAYKNRMIDFISMENMASSIFPIDTSLASKEKTLSDINDIGIYYWNRNLEVLNSLDSLKLPSTLIKKNNLFKEYCILNRKCYQLIYKAVNERTEKYDQEINKYVLKIEEKKTYLRANY